MTQPEIHDDSNDDQRVVLITHTVEDGPVARWYVHLTAAEYHNNQLRRALLALAAALAVITTPDAATASPTPVYVEDHTGSAWPVYAAQNFVDQYTGTNLIYGACRTGYKCIRIYELYYNRAYSANTCIPNQACTDNNTGAVLFAGIVSYWRIYLNSYRRSYPWAARRNIITHELGHANGIYYHSVYCTNVMYGHVFCPNGTLPAYRFTDPQKTILARN